MSSATQQIQAITEREYEWGFVTDIDEDSVAPGLNEEVIRLISAKKTEPDWLLERRLEAYRRWLAMPGEPGWAKIHHPPIDYQAISYFAAPRRREAPKSLDDVDPEAGTNWTASAAIFSLLLAMPQSACISTYSLPSLELAK